MQIRCTHPVEMDRKNYVFTEIMRKYAKTKNSLLRHNTAATTMQREAYYISLIFMISRTTETIAGSLTISRGARTSVCQPISRVRRKGRHF